MIRSPIRWYRLTLLFLFSLGANDYLAKRIITVTHATNHEEDDLPTSELSIPLFASHLSHHAYIYIGSPPQRRLVIVDTGSRLLSFPCKPCKSCGNAHVSDVYWDPEVSTTDVHNDCIEERCVFRDVLKACEESYCIIQQSFTEGSSLIAYETSDLTWLGTENVSESIGLHMHTAVPFTFGCLVAETGLIKAQYADGILGLSMHEANLISVMYGERSIRSNAFSLCLSRVVGGFLTVGGVLISFDAMTTDDDSNDDDDNGTFKNGVVQLRGHHHLKEMMQFEPLSSKLSYYTVQITSVRIDNVTLPLSSKHIYDHFSSGKGTVVDSGSSDTYFPRGIAETFREVWGEREQEQQGVGAKHTNHPEMYTYGQFKRLPDVVITLSGGYDWVIRPNAYMEVIKPLSYSTISSGQDTMDVFTNGWTGEIKLANRIYLDEPTGCVLGANAMYEHDILFDIGRKRIGIAKADCRYNQRRV